MASNVKSLDLLSDLPEQVPASTDLSAGGRRCGDVSPVSSPTPKRESFTNVPSWPWESPRGPFPFVFRGMTLGSCISTEDGASNSAGMSCIVLCQIVMRRTRTRSTITVFIFDHTPLHIAYSSVSSFTSPQVHSPSLTQLLSTASSVPTKVVCFHPDVDEGNFKFLGLSRCSRMP
jgi:hypothetical protein